jgi:hypothetical protein
MDESFDNDTDVMISVSLHGLLRKEDPAGNDL